VNKIIIQKIFNNNVLAAIDENKNEVVVMGKGIAFQSKKGEEVDVAQIEKTFILKDERVEHLHQLLQETSPDFLEIASEIVNLAKEHLTSDFEDYLYVALTDHLSFAMKRYQDGVYMPNNLLYEVRKYYKEEFKVGIKALDIIENYTSVRFEEDEAASIAMHLVNGSLSSDNMQLTMETTEIVNRIMQIVTYYYQITLDEETINYERFVSHLRFFAARYFRNEGITDSVQPELYTQVKKSYPVAFSCMEKIAIYMDKEKQWELSKDEKMYLTIHLHRLTKRESNGDVNI